MSDDRTLEDLSRYELIRAVESTVVERDGQVTFYKAELAKTEQERDAARQEAERLRQELADMQSWQVEARDTAARVSIMSCIDCKVEYVQSSHLSFRGCPACRYGKRNAALHAEVSQLKADLANQTEHRMSAEKWLAERNAEVSRLTKERDEQAPSCPECGTVATRAWLRGHTRECPTGRPAPIGPIEDD